MEYLQQRERGTCHPVLRCSYIYVFLKDNSRALSYRNKIYQILGSTHCLFWSEEKHKYLIIIQIELDLSIINNTHPAAVFLLKGVKQKVCPLRETCLSFRTYSHMVLGNWRKTNSINWWSLLSTPVYLILGLLVSAFSGFILPAGVRRWATNSRWYSVWRNTSMKKDNKKFTIHCWWHRWHFSTSPRRVYVVIKFYLLLTTLCFWMTPQLMEATVSGFVNEVRQSPQTVRPDVRLVMPFGLRHETVR